MSKTLFDELADADTKEEVALIREWLDKIGETDRENRNHVREVFRRDKSVKKYLLSRCKED